jgi:hypothetical protein
MMMFGVIHFQGDGTGANDYIKAGWNNVAPPVAQQIITFDNAACVAAANGGQHTNCTAVDVNHNVNDPSIPDGQITRKALFEREFRKIASTSVGRVLLYRILIEIRRHQPGGNIGYPEHPGYVSDIPNVNNDNLLQPRNVCRRLEVRYGANQNDFFFSPNGILSFFAHVDNSTVVGKTIRGQYTHIVHCLETISSSLFHEMTHWFHHLRNTVRRIDERNLNQNNRKNFENYFLGRYYWHGLNRCVTEWSGRVISEEPWRANCIFGPTNYVTFEEIRTVLGAPYLGSIENYPQNYIQGDDLSENLYRMCVGLPLRFGYALQTFYEDVKVINRVNNACLANYLWYSKGYNPANFNYNIGRQGLGKHRIQ